METGNSVFFENDPYLFQKISNNDDTDTSLEEYICKFYKVFTNEEQTSFTIGRK